MAIGLRSKSQMRAITILLGILVVATMSGPILIYTLDLLGQEAPDLRLLAKLTPASWLLFLERSYPDKSVAEVIWPRFWGLGSVVLLYGVIALLLRWRILAVADAYLGRVREGELVVELVDDKDDE